MSLSTLGRTCLVGCTRSFSNGCRIKSVQVHNTLWTSQKFSGLKLLKNFRLVGLGFSISLAPLLRVVECKANKTELIKRAELLKTSKSEEIEPSLSLADIWSLLKPYLGYFVAAVLSAILTAAVNIQLPLYLGQLIDELVRLIKDQAKGLPSDLSSIQPHAIKLVICYSAQAFLTFCYISFLTVLGERMAADLRIKLFERLIVMDMSFYDSNKSAELSSRLNVDVQEFKSCFKLSVAQGLKTAAQTAGCMVTLLKISPEMTVMTVAALPIVIAVGTLCGALLRGLSRRAQAQSAVAGSVADEAFGNIRTVRAFAMEQQELSLFTKEVVHARYLNELLGFGIGVFQGATNFFLNGIVLSVLYGGSSLINSGQMTPGDLMSFLVTAQTIQKSLSQFSVIFGHALKGWTAGARVFQFINIMPTVRMDDGICIPHHSLSGTVKFENVSFSYPSRKGHPVFENLNLTIPAGKVVALCGPSGEGKSTITALLERFYEPKSGRITLDGKDLRLLNLEWLRGQVVGLISQEPVLFATTIEENIRYGKPSATDTEVREAAQMANASTFIDSFPDDYKTVVGERGTQLSGGQKQRIAIARALLKNPPILILDEATSALDSDSERQVRDALERAKQGRTVLVIAHRLSTIQNSDVICVIKDKKVAEQGTHAELIKRKGIYWNLVQSQYTQG